MNIGTWLAESGGVPDFVLRHVIRLRHKAVRDSEDPGAAKGHLEALRAFIRTIHAEPVACIAWPGKAP